MQLTPMACDWMEGNDNLTLTGIQPPPVLNRLPFEFTVQPPFNLHVLLPSPPSKDPQQNNWENLKSHHAWSRMWMIFSWTMLTSWLSSSWFSSAVLFLERNADHFGSEVLSVRISTRSVSTLMPAVSNKSQYDLGSPSFQVTSKVFLVMPKQVQIRVTAS